MQWDTPKQNRTAILKKFSKNLSIVPCLMEINGENEWVDNLIQFGDLVTKNMGVDAGEFYFEQLYDLLLLEENSSFDFDEYIEQEDEQEEKHEEIKSEVKPSGGKQGKKVRGSCKRLF